MSVGVKVSANSCSKELRNENGDNTPEVGKGRFTSFKSSFRSSIKRRRFGDYYKILNSESERVDDQHSTRLSLKDDNIFPFEVTEPPLISII